MRINLIAAVLFTRGTASSFDAATCAAAQRLAQCGIEPTVIIARPPDDAIVRHLQAYQMLVKP